MQGMWARRCVLLIVLGGCGSGPTPGATPLSTSALGQPQGVGEAVRAEPWSPMGQPDWRSEGQEPGAPSGRHPGWGRPIDPGIGDGEMPEIWRHRPRPGPRPTPSVTPPPPDDHHWPPRRWPPRRWPPIGWPGYPPWGGPAPLPLPQPPEINPAIVDEFRQLDLDGSGWLSPREYVEGKMAQIRYFQAPTDEENAATRQRLFDEFVQGDVNRDGRMSVYEYANNPNYHILGS